MDFCCQRKMIQDLENKILSHHVFVEAQEVETCETFLGKKVFRKTYVTDGIINVGRDGALHIQDDLTFTDELWIDMSNSFMKTKSSNIIYPLTANMDHDYASMGFSVWCNKAGVRLISDSGWSDQWVKVVTIKYTKL